MSGKTTFDPEKYCECPTCCSVHRKGSYPSELQPSTVVENCKWCSGIGLRLGDPDHPEKGYTKCDHQPPQPRMEF